MFLETILADAVHLETGPRRPPSALAGRWRNRLGSTMQLIVDDDHRVHGTFHSGVGVPEATTFPVAGFAEGDAVAFCVDFGRRGSVATWAGHHVADDSGDRLVTLWHLVQPPLREAHDEADVWGSLLAGSDEFIRVAD